jgi:hypothetical protein
MVQSEESAERIMHQQGLGIGYMTGARHLSPLVARMRVRGLGRIHGSSLGMLQSLLVVLDLALQGGWMARRQAVTGVVSSWRALQQHAECL